MTRLIDIAKVIKPGWKIRIMEYTDEPPAEGGPSYSRPLTDAQIIAYQDKLVVNTEVSMHEKTMFCTIIDRENYKEKTSRQEE